MLARASTKTRTGTSAPKKARAATVPTPTELRTRQVLLRLEGMGEGEYGLVLTDQDRAAVKRAIAEGRPFVAATQASERPWVRARTTPTDLWAFIDNWVSSVFFAHRYPDATPAQAMSTDSAAEIAVAMAIELRDDEGKQRNASSRRISTKTVGERWQGEMRRYEKDEESPLRERSNRGGRDPLELARQLQALDDDLVKRLMRISLRRAGVSKIDTSNIVRKRLPRTPSSEDDRIRSFVSWSIERRVSAIQAELGRDPSVEELQQAWTSRRREQASTGAERGDPRVRRSDADEVLEALVKGETSDALFKDYKTYCESRGMTVMTKTAFGLEMGRSPDLARHNFAPKTGGRLRGWDGVGLKKST
jgi:hypothetical protein